MWKCDSYSSSPSALLCIAVAFVGSLQLHTLMLYWIWSSNNDTSNMMLSNFLYNHCRSCALLNSADGEFRCLTGCMQQSNLISLKYIIFPFHLELNKNWSLFLDLQIYDFMPHSLYNNPPELSKTLLLQGQ